MRIQSTKSSLAFLAGASLLLTSAPPVMAAGDGAVHSTVLISDQIFDVCNNEIVDFTGTLSIHTNVTTDANGNMHISSHGITIADAVGETTGFTYQFHSGVENETNVDASFTTGEFTLKQNDALIGQGQAPNLLFKGTNHMTVNANGVVTAFHVSGDFLCH
jgi:hypothetical protein